MVSKAAKMEPRARLISIRKNKRAHTTVPGIRVTTCAEIVSRDFSIRFLITTLERGPLQLRKKATRLVVPNCFRIQIPKFHFEMLLINLAQEDTENVDCCPKMDKPNFVFNLFGAYAMIF